MRRILTCVGFLFTWASPLPAAQLRVENDGGGTSSIVSPGTTSVSLLFVSVTEAEDNLPGVGWFGGSHQDITHSVTGSVVATLSPANVTIGSVWTDAGTNSSGIDTPTGVRNIIFATQLQFPGPGDQVGDRVTIAYLIGETGYRRRVGSYGGCSSKRT